MTNPEKKELLEEYKKLEKDDTKLQSKNNLIDSLLAPKNHFEGSGKDTIFFIDGEKIPVNKIFALGSDYKNYIEPSEYDKKGVSEYGIKPKNNVLIETVIDSMSPEEIKNNIEVFKKILLLPEFSGGPAGVKNLVKHLGLIKFDEDGNIDKSEFNMKYSDDRAGLNHQMLGNLLIRAISNGDLVYIIFTSKNLIDWSSYAQISHGPVS